MVSLYGYGFRHQRPAPMQPISSYTFMCHRYDRVLIQRIHAPFACVRFCLPIRYRTALTHILSVCKTRFFNKGMIIYVTIGFSSARWTSRRTFMDVRKQGGRTKPATDRGVVHENHHPTFLASFPLVIILRRRSSESTFPVLLAGSKRGNKKRLLIVAVNDSDHQGYIYSGKCLHSSG